MRKALIPIAACLAVTFVLVSVCRAAGEAQKRIESLGPPEGYDRLFGELADLMKKYSGAADRFSILDKKGPKSTPTSRSCCEFHCGGSECLPHRCCCTMEYLE